MKTGKIANFMAMTGCLYGRNYRLKERYKDRILAAEIIFLRLVVGVATQHRISNDNIKQHLKSLEPRRKKS